MTSTTPDRAGRTVVVAGPRLGTTQVVLLVMAAGAWVAITIWSRALGNGPGTMGLGPLRFVAMWTLMMAAMMLPSVARVVRPSEAAAPERRAADPRRVAEETFVFVAGYLLVWVATGLPAFGVAVMAGRLAARHPTVATAGAAVIFALCGVYQFTATKCRCLEHCRARLSVDGTLATALRGGARYGGWCLACSWGAMALMIAFGLMNVAAMAVLALVISAERLWFPGRLSSRLAGSVSLAFVVLVVVSPSLAAGLHEMPPMPHM